MPHPGLPRLSQVSYSSGSPRTQIMPFTALEPPRARPRGQKICRPLTFSSRSVWKRQIARSPVRMWAMPAGMRIHIQRSSSPASRSSTRCLPEAVRRLASTQPAEPAPTMM